MLWKVKDNGVQSGSEPVGSTRSLPRSVRPSCSFFFPPSHHLCLSVTHAHIHRSFSLTHLNAVSLFLSRSVGGTRCAALRCRGLSPPQVRQAPLLWWICHFSPALSDSRSPGLHPLPLSPARSSLNLREKIYILYLTDTSPWAGWNSTHLEYRPTCYYLFNALTERRRKKQMAERRREM